MGVNKVTELLGKQHTRMRVLCFPILEGFRIGKLGSFSMDWGGGISSESGHFRAVRKAETVTRAKIADCYGVSGFEGRKIGNFLSIGPGPADFGILSGKNGSQMSTGFLVIFSQNLGSSRRIAGAICDWENVQT